MCLACSRNSGKTSVVGIGQVRETVVEGKVTEMSRARSCRAVGHDNNFGFYFK